MDKGKKENPKSNKNNHSSEKPKIREVKIEESFFDEEDDKNDKRLVVFAIIAILVILATIVTLVIGCDKKKKEEPVKPNDDIVVPEQKENEKDKDGYDDGVVTPEIVRKVTASYRGSKTIEATEEEDNTEDNSQYQNEEKPKYTVTYYFNDEEVVKEVEEGSKIEEYIPDGYSTCKYYDDEDLENEIDLDKEITDNMHVHMTCEVITYTIEYDNETTNPTTYTVEDNDTDLLDIDNEDFGGWFADSEFQNQVITLNKDIISYADENNIIHLYAFFGGHSIDCEGDECEGVDPTTDSQITTDTEKVDCTGEDCIVQTEEDNQNETLNDENDSVVTTDTNNPEVGDAKPIENNGENVIETQTNENTTQDNLEVVNDNLVINNNVEENKVEDEKPSTPVVEDKPDVNNPEEENNNKEVVSQEEETKDEEDTEGNE